MKKEELKWKILNLFDAVEDSSQEEFDDTEIEDLVVEAGIPTSRTLPNLRAVPGQGR